MSIERKMRLWNYAKFFGMFLVGIVFAVAVQAVAQSTETTEAAPEEEEETFTDCMTSASSLLRYKQLALNRRESDIGQREEDLDNAEKRLEKQFEKLQEIREELRVMMADMDEKKKKKVQGLVDRFSKVRAKQAAAILEVTDDDVSLLVLDTMPAAKSGKILAAMTPEKAAKLTEKLAQHPLKKGEQSTEKKKGQ